MTDITTDWEPSEAMAARWIMDWAARFPDAGFGRLPVSVVAKSLREEKPKIEAAERERMRVAVAKMDAHEDVIRPHIAAQARAKALEEAAKVADGWDFGGLIAEEIRALKDSKP